MASGSVNARSGGTVINVHLALVSIPVNLTVARVPSKEALCTQRQM